MGVWYFDAELGWAWVMRVCAYAPHGQVVLEVLGGVPDHAQEARGQEARGVWGAVWPSSEASPCPRRVCSARTGGRPGGRGVLQHFQ